jgi:hypothetical protein
MRSSGLHLYTKLLTPRAAAVRILIPSRICRIDVLFVKNRRECHVSEGALLRRDQVFATDAISKRFPQVCRYVFAVPTKVDNRLPIRIDFVAEHWLFRCLIAGVGLPVIVNVVPVTAISPICTCRRALAEVAADRESNAAVGQHLSLARAWTVTPFVHYASGGPGLPRVRVGLFTAKCSGDDLRVQ